MFQFFKKGNSQNIKAYGQSFTLNYYVKTWKQPVCLIIGTWLNGFFNSYLMNY